VFIRRSSRDAVQQKHVFEDRLLAGHRLLFFPEGTSTDGLQVLPFKPTLFAAFFSDALRDQLWVQPVSVTYFAPEGEDPRHYGWWGDMEFGIHLLQTLATRRHGRIVVVWSDPLAVSDFPNRKALAKVSEAAVRAGHGLID
jgi:1-acyl-sn-glycerol-3-phosphate acyltransferase